MCGIVGILGSRRSKEELGFVLGAMMRSLEHRGPDAEGTSLGAGWALGQVRLSINDVEGGNQPIWNEDKTICVFGNNEIYNSPELRRELEILGHRFSTRSDTEVILHGWEQWGDAVFARLNGMFAVALLDQPNQRCVLARDPLGIKPLHVLKDGESLLFSSESKAFFAMPGKSPRLNLDSLHLFMNLRYLPGEQTLFEGVEKFPPGHFAVINLLKPELNPRRYFSLSEISVNEKIGFDEARVELEEKLEKSVKRHLLSDVPVGTYLSGGIDSSLVTAIASKELPRIRSYCLGFGEPTDEIEDARAVARLFNTDHQEYFVGESPLDRFEEVIWFTEEPKVNCMQGYVLAERVAKDIKVVLSGLGGDELFAGYVNNDILYPMSQFCRWFSASSGSRNIDALHSHFSTPSSDFYFRCSELALNVGNPLQYYAVLRNSFDHSDHLLNGLYVKPQSHWKHMTVEALAGAFNSQAEDLMNEFLRLEMRTKLTNDFLLSEDRVAMAHGVETRVPFLDLELVNFAFSLPSSFKYKPGNRKRILKAAARKWLPEKVLSKKKHGFSFNPHLLFQGNLGQMARRVLSRSRVEELGVFSWKWVSSILEAPPSPKLRWHYFNLWVMLGFILWHEKFIERKRSEPIAASL